MPNLTNSYETVIILSNNLGDEAIAATIEKFKKLATKKSLTPVMAPGSVIGVNVSLLTQSKNKTKVTIH